MPVSQGPSSHPPKSPVRSLASLVFLVALLSAVLIYDHSLLEQIQGFLRSGWPGFARNDTASSLSNYDVGPSKAHSQIPRLDDCVCVGTQLSSRRVLAAIALHSSAMADWRL